MQPSFPLTATVPYRKPDRSEKVLAEHACNVATPTDAVVDPDRNFSGVAHAQKYDVVYGEIIRKTKNVFTKLQNYTFSKIVNFSHSRSAPAF